jgi:hypothetical protein
VAFLGYTTPVNRGVAQLASAYGWGP